jgi:urease accessory protein
MQAMQVREQIALAFTAVALGIGLWLAPDIAAAHIIQSGAAGFGSGFVHPLTGPDHFLAMFAVGLWGAQMGGPSVIVRPRLALAC